MGGSNANPTSRFLKDIPASLTATRERTGQAVASHGLVQVHQRIASPADGWSPPRERREVPSDLAFSAGDQVRHTKFGDGIVVDCKATGSDQEVTVSFKGGHGLKRLLLSYAPLELIRRA